MGLYLQLKFLLIVFLFSILSGCLPAVRPKSSVIAQVNGSYITRSDIMEELKQFHFRQFQSGLSKGEHPDMEKFLDELIDKNLIIQEAGRIGLEQESGIQEDLVERKHSRQYEERVLYHLFFEKIVKPQVQVTNQEIEQYYHDNLSLFNKGAMIFLEQIGVKDADQANQIHQDLIKGADFAFLGKVSPDGNIEYSKQWIQLQKIKPELRKHLSRLKEGEISSPFKYGRDYFIFRVKRKKGGSLVPFDLAKKRIEKKLISQKLRTITNDCLHRLREISKIIIYHDNLQKLISNYQP